MAGKKVTESDAEGKLSQRAMDRRKRQTAALRANLKRRKTPDPAAAENTGDNPEDPAK